MRLPASNTRTQGFTIVEVAVIVPIVMVVALALYAVLFSFVSSIGTERTRLYTAYNLQSAMDRIETDTRLSAQFMPSRDSNYTDKYESQSSGSQWNYKGIDTNNRVLMLKEYATSTSSQSTVRQPVYTKKTSSADCSNAANIGGALTYMVIYFVDQNTDILYRRTVTDTSSYTCAQQYQKLSCPSLDTLGTTSRDGACGADDEVVAEHVSQFSIDYYVGNDTTKQDVYTSDQPTRVSSATSVNVTLGISQRSYGKTVTSSTALKIARLNPQAATN